MLESFGVLFHTRKNRKCIGSMGQTRNKMDESGRSVAGARKGGKQGSSNPFRAELHVRVSFPTPHFVDEELVRATEVAPAPILLPGSIRSPRGGGIKLGHPIKRDP